MFKLLCCAVLALLISLLISLLIEYYLFMNNSTNNNQVQSYSASNKEIISIPHVKNPFNVPTFYIVYGDGYIKSNTKKIENIKFIYSRSNLEISVKFFKRDGILAFACIEGLLNLTLYDTNMIISFNDCHNSCTYALSTHKEFMSKLEKDFIECISNSDSANSVNVFKITYLPDSTNNTPVTEMYEYSKQLCIWVVNDRVSFDENYGKETDRWESVSIGKLKETDSELSDFE